MILYNDLRTMWAMYSPTRFAHVTTRLLEKYKCYRTQLQIIGYLHIAAVGLLLYELFSVLRKKTWHTMLSPFVGMAISLIAVLLIPEQITSLGILHTASLVYSIDILFRIFQARSLDRLTRPDAPLYTLAELVRNIFALLFVAHNLPLVSVFPLSKGQSEYSTIFMPTQLLWNTVFYTAGTYCITIPALLQAIYLTHKKNRSLTIPKPAARNLLLCTGIPILIGLLSALIMNIDPVNSAAVWRYFYWRPIYLLCSVISVVILGNTIRQVPINKART